MLFKFLTVILLCDVIVYYVSGTVIDLLQLDNTTCPYKIHHLNQYTIYEVRWDGRELPYKCKMSFIGRDISDALVSYQICVKTHKYDVNDCDFKMKYFRGYGSKIAAKEYSCYHEKPQTFCADADEYLDLQFQAASPTVSSLTLIVTAEELETHETQRVLVYVGIGIAATVLSVGVLVMFIMYRKKQQQRTQGMIMHHTTPVIQNTTMYASAPPNKQYLQTGQGFHPAPPMIGQQSTPMAPPPYSEVSTEDHKLPLPSSETSENIHKK